MKRLGYSKRSISFFIVGTLLSFSILLSACSTNKNVSDTSSMITTAVPIITLDLATIDLGDLVEGETRTMVYSFTNTGTETLQIDLVTACKCTDLRWTQEPIPSGEKGTIEVDFDSTGFSGEIKKTIDIIANTEPLVTEAFFTATVVKKL